MEQISLKVQMLGEFSVTYNDRILLSENNRNKKVVNLFQYLLIMHGHAVKQDELISKLFCDADDYDDPVHMLKNIVYRLRKFLASSGLPEREYIYYKKGAYGLCEDILCEIDFEKFENAVKNAGAEANEPDACLCFYREAILCYAGDFLSKSSNLLWVTPRAMRYQKMFIDCVKSTYDILLAQNNLTSMLDIFEKALMLYPYEEQLHVLHISALYALNRIKDAISEYDFVINLLFDELGVSPSEEMLAIYRRITETMKPGEGSIDDIRNEMNEETLEKGPYYCNYLIFTNTYRCFVRQAERSGKSAYLLLATFSDSGSSIDNSSARMANTSVAFHNAVKSSLRRGDIYTRFSPTQFIVLLMDINIENSKIVTNRIAENFYKQMKSKQTKLTMKLMSAIDIEYVLQG